MKAIIGRKLGMTQILSDDGKALPVTLIQAGPCTVTQIKTTDTDGYEAIQLGFGEAKKLSKSVTGHVKKAKIMPAIIREFRIPATQETSVGVSFHADVFEDGDVVSVSSISKGKGFAGTVKRHNFNTSKKTHGGNGNVRKPGSIGSMYPQKVFKGKKMSGRMGATMTTVKNQKIAYVNKEKNVIGIVGNIPGAKGSVVTIEGAK